MRALRILSLDYLDNQQFDNLILKVEASMISRESGTVFDVLSCFGNKLPVSANLFGKNLKPYEVTEISLKIDDIDSSVLSLGGQQVALSSLMRNK